jgi:hypothetical protein
VDVISIKRRKSPKDATLEPVLEARGTARSGLFNPREISLVRTVGWKESKLRNMDLPQVQFDSGAQRRLSLSLAFDTYEAERPRDVREFTGKLAKLAEVADGQSQPPVCVVSWGRDRPLHEGLPFTGVVESLTQKFTMFLEDGTPVRATVDLQLKGVDAPEKQLKRTQRARTSPLQARTRVVRQGDAIWAIAAEEYGDPARWRPIAEANDLADPRVLAPGSRLTIPTQE